MVDDPNPANEPTTDQSVTTAPEPEPDYKAELAKAQADAKSSADKVAQLEQQVSGFKGSMGQRLDMEAELRRVHRVMARNAEMLDVLAERQLAADPVGADRLQAVKTQHQQSDKQDAAQQQLFNAFENMADEVADIVGEDLPSDFNTRWTRVWTLINTRPELQSVQAQAVRAANDADLAGLSDSFKALKRIRREKELTQREAARVQAHKEAEAAATEKLTRAGVFSTAAASTAAAGNGKRTEFTQAEIEDGGPEFVKQHFDEIKAAQRAGRIK